MYKVTQCYLIITFALLPLYDSMMIMILRDNQDIFEPLSSQLMPFLYEGAHYSAGRDLGTGGMSL